MTESCSWIRLEVVREKSPFYSVTVKSPEDAYRIVRDFLEKCDRETVLEIMLDAKHHVNGIHLVSIGSLDASVVSPREVYKAAILANAAAIIVAHNHPSGDPTPSQEDIETANKIKQAGDLLGINMLDFLVIGDKSFISLMSKGLIG
jgi:DNA repair protein RadC